jgi:hypothetical protein
VAVKRERPVPVVVLALTSLLLGGVGLLAAAAVQAVCWVSDETFAGGVIVPMSPALAMQLRLGLPGFFVFEMILPGLALCLAALVMASGLVLLSGGRWARSAAMTAAGVVLLALVLVAAYESVVVLPGIEHWREVGWQQNNRLEVEFTGPLWVAPLLLIGGLIYFVHAVATLVVLRAPAVAEAYRRGSNDE